jgi:hypothetical protein
MAHFDGKLDLKLVSPKDQQVTCNRDLKTYKTGVPEKL